MLRVLGCSGTFGTVGTLVQFKAMQILPLTTVSRKEPYRVVIQILFVIARLLYQYRKSVYESSGLFRNYPTIFVMAF